MLGDFTPGKTVTGKFNTHKADGTPVTLAGTPVLSVYKDSTTESTAGVTLTVDYDSRTGMHRFSIDTSADGTFYAAGNDFQVVITTGTVDSISVVGTVVGAFSLSNRSALRPATADRTLVVDAAGLADATAVKLGPSGSGTALTARDIGASVLLASGTGTGQVKLSGGYVAPNWGDVGNPATTVNLSGTTVGAVTAAAVASIAADAVNAAALSSDAVAEIKAAIVTNTLTVDAGGVVSANVTQWGGSPVLWNSDGVPVVDVGYWQGSAVANLNAGLVRADVFAVEAGTIGTASFAAGATVPRVTLCDTLTTYTGNTPQSGDAFARIGATGSGLTALATAAGVAALPTADQNADALLGRNVAGGSSTGRLVKEALYALRNKVAIVGTTMQVMSTDDVTVAWSATVTPAAGADPISAIDPTG